MHCLCAGRFIVETLQVVIGKFRNSFHPMLKLNVSQFGQPMRQQKYTGFVYRANNMSAN
jgi:hypothetical protein